MVLSFDFVSKLAMQKPSMYVMCMPICCHNIVYCQYFLNCYDTTCKFVIHVNKYVSLTDC